VEKREVALIAQRAEMRFAGTQCGIMDQYAVLFGRGGCALFLDTRTLEYESVPTFDDAVFVICDTMVKRELAASRYNERRKECEQSVRFLQERFPQVEQLRDVTLEQLEEARDLLGPTLFERCKHVVTENDRVLRARDALVQKDASTFGGLMGASHASLRDQYQVSCSELDTMVDLARGSAGVYGARMTGGGFGGCTINLVGKNHQRDFAATIAQAYHRETGMTPRIYDGTPGSGASRIDA
jgi:galactokinase